jgi:hypothetical protein
MKAHDAIIESDESSESGHKPSKIEHLREEPFSGLRSEFVLLL